MVVFLSVFTTVQTQIGRDVCLDALNHWPVSQKIKLEHRFDNHSRNLLCKKILAEADISDNGRLDNVVIPTHPRPGFPDERWSVVYDLLVHLRIKSVTTCNSK